MADVGQVNTSSYQPLQFPQQQAMTPLDTLRLIGQMSQNQFLQQRNDALQGIGQAYNRNVSLSGDINVGGLRGDIARNGGILAGEALGQATTNSDADLKLRSSWQQTLRGIYGQLGTQPSVNDDDLAAAKVAAAGAGVPPGVIQNFTSTMPRVQSAKDQNARRQWLVTQSNLARGPETTATGVTVQGPNGESVQIPEGTASRARAAGGLQTTRIPGVTDADVESRKTLVEDQKSAARTMANLRNLDIALPAVEKLGNPNYGPGSPQLASLKASLATAGIIDPNTSDVTVRQELNKYLLKYATMAQNAGRSDQALAAAVGSNPNLDLTQPANLGLIKNQIGLDRMDASMSKIFKLEHPALEEGSQYNDYKSNYYNRFDRRAFSFDKLSPEERRDLVQSLGPKSSPAYKKFSQTYQLAKQAGVLVPEK